LTYPELPSHDAFMAAGSLGYRVKRARERRRWTQQQLADRLGVNRKTVDNWENDRTYPRSAIGALEQVLGDLTNGGEPDPEVLEIRELAERVGRTTQEQKDLADAWIATYEARKPPQERAG
jgi:transcriptional regulator with XRE-family HTH domain